MLRRRVIRLPLLVAAIAMLWIGSKPASGSHVVGSPSEIGQIGPLILSHKDAITAVVVWTGEKRDKPQVCYWMRNSQYKGTDLVDPNGVSPQGGPTGGYIDDFRVHVRGGSRFSDRLDRSSQSLITNDLYLDNGLCLDLTHPDAFKNAGLSAMATYDPVANKWVANFSPADYWLNAAALTQVGRSAGLNYDIFCSANVQLPDGRIAFFGGHYIDGDFGLRKVNIFDPVTLTWVPRAEPAVKKEYLAHPTGDHTLHPHPNANVEVNGDPPTPSDMKYQRWYPSAVTLPNGMVLVLSGTDNNKSTPGAPDVQNTVPEVYDPKTDTFIALENARKMLPNYPLAYVVQTGKGPTDWKVAVTGEYASPPAIIPAQPPALGSFVGKTYYLDVLAAIADPNRDVPGENHWEFVSMALSAHHAAGAAQLWELDRKGEATSQRIVAFGGSSRGGTVVATVEMLDYQAVNPLWETQDDLLRPVDDNYAAVLPDGKVLIVGGESPAGMGFVPRSNLHYQMFDPATGKIQVLGATTVPLRDHTTMVLLPDATVLVGGSDRPNMLPGDLAPAPGAPTDRDSGVPVFSVYKPPYLFTGNRPVIQEAPDEIEYGKKFELEVSGVSGDVGSVALVMPSPETHKWDWGNRYVKLSFEAKKEKGEGAYELKVSAPAQPGLALPGYYMLFVLSDEGVPSEAKLVQFSVPEKGDHGDDGDHRHRHGHDKDD